MSIQSLVTKILGKVPLRTILIVPFVLQIVGAVGVVGYLSFRNGQRAVNEVVSELRSEVSDRIEQNLRILVATPPLVNQSNATALSLGQLNVKNLNGLERHFWHQVSLFDQIALAGFADSSKEVVLAQRQDNGFPTISVSGKSTGYQLWTYTTNSQGERLKLIHVDKSFNPHQRPYYKAAVEAGKETWAAIFPHVNGKTLCVASSQPVYDQIGKLKGVLLADFNLLQIGNFLQRLEIGKTGQSFIIERTGALIATSTSEKPFRINNNKVVKRSQERVDRLQVTESSNLITQATGNHLLARFGDFNPIKTVQQLEFKIDGERQFVQVLPFHDDRGLDWLIVVVVPETDFMEQIQAHNRITILLCLAALVLVVVIGILTAQWITQPIVCLIYQRSDCEDWH
ncbi:MAG: cache domain-containing protein [Cyanobacteriota bacterium]